MWLSWVGCCVRSNRPHCCCCCCCLSDVQHSTEPQVLPVHNTSGLMTSHPDLQSCCHRLSMSLGLRPTAQQQNSTAQHTGGQDSTVLHSMAVHHARSVQHRTQHNPAAAHIAAAVSDPMWSCLLRAPTPAVLLLPVLQGLLVLLLLLLAAPHTPTQLATLIAAA